MGIMYSLAIKNKVYAYNSCVWRTVSFLEQFSCSCQIHAMVLLSPNFGFNVDYFIRIPVLDSLKFCDILTKCSQGVMRKESDGNKYRRICWCSQVNEGRRSCGAFWSLHCQKWFCKGDFEGIFWIFKTFITGEIG